jgi:cell division septal protein FtsQ
MHQAKTIRTIDAVASRKRMKELNLIEEVRKSNIREQEKKRKQRDRQLLFAAGVGLLLFILAIVIFSLLI